MPRVPSEKVKEAEKLYHKGGMSLADIAKKLGIQAGTVRRWKYDYNWDAPPEKRQSERSEKKAKRKRTFGKREGRKGIRIALGTVEVPRKETGMQKSMDSFPDICQRNHLTFWMK